jgi:hypothetical protein
VSIIVYIPASIPVLYKSSFALDPQPLEAMSSPHAGHLVTSRVFRSLGIPALNATEQRHRGLPDGQMLESLVLLKTVLLQTVGGECVEDMKTIAGDTCLERGLGYELPAVNTLRDFLNKFHDENLALLRLRPRGYSRRVLSFRQASPWQGFRMSLRERCD